jgi:hypothetical protein
MGQLTRFAAAAAAIAMAATSVLGTSVAAADDSGSKVVPLSSVLRRCDGGSVPYVPSDTTGSVYAVFSSVGGTVTAEVHAAGLKPDIWYGVRLVQVPRPTVGCGGGDPGVAMARLYTDGAGIGTVTASGPIMNGATGAWVSVEGPLGVANQMTGDFFTSDYVTGI